MNADAEIEKKYRKYLEEKIRQILPELLDITTTIIPESKQKKIFGLRKSLFGAYKIKKSEIHQYKDDWSSYYECVNKNTSFMVRGKPIRIYGDRYVLTIDGKYNTIYLNGEGFSLNPISIGNVNYYSTQFPLYIANEKKVCYDDNFILCSDYPTKLFLMFSNQVIEFDFFRIQGYKNNAETIKKLSANFERLKQIYNIFTFEQFKYYNMPSLAKELSQIQAAEAERIKLHQIATAKQKELEEKEERREKQIQALKQLKEALDILNELEQDNIEITRIRYDNVFVQRNDHLEISPTIIHMLKYVDLSFADFKNVKCSGIDFRECNIGSFNPQLVYNRDLSGSNFEGVFISPFMNFKDVDIRGAKFSADNDPKTIDVFNESFRYAIYDETTTYNGISLAKVFNQNQRSAVEAKKK